MGNNMFPYAIMVGEKYTYFIAHHYKFIENDKIEEGTLLSATDGSLDPYEYHLEKSGKDVFKTKEANRIHTFWPGLGEDVEKEDDFSDVEDENEEAVDKQELEYTDGKNEVVKIFSQKCVICLERDNEYIFKQCGHQCICDNDILKCVICRT